MVLEAGELGTLGEGMVLKCIEFAFAYLDLCCSTDGLVMT